MRTIDDFRYTLNFRNIAGGSRSFDDLAALRELLAEEVRRMSAVLGAAAAQCWASDLIDLAQDIEHHKGHYVGLIEADIMSIDAFLASRKK
jgi:hypothetical protein